MTTWRLVMPDIEERFTIVGSLSVTMIRHATIFGDEDGLFISTLGDIPEGADEWGAIPYNTKYIWYGGHENLTDDPDIRALWLAHSDLGITVEEVT